MYSCLRAGGARGQTQIQRSAEISWAHRTIAPLAMAMVLDGGRASGRPAASRIALGPGGHRWCGAPNLYGAADQGGSARGKKKKERKCGHCGKSLTSFARCEGKCASASSPAPHCGCSVCNCVTT